jgi:hypothetical protein
MAASEIGEIHESLSARNQEKLAAVQSTQEFLIDNNCPPNLRIEIIQVHMGGTLAVLDSESILSCVGWFVV